MDVVMFTLCGAFCLTFVQCGWLWVKSITSTLESNVLSWSSPPATYTSLSNINDTWARRAVFILGASCHEASLTLVSRVHTQAWVPPHQPPVTISLASCSTTLVQYSCSQGKSGPGGRWLTSPSSLTCSLSTLLLPWPPIMYSSLQPETHQNKHSYHNNFLMISNYNLTKQPTWQL